MCRLDDGGNAGDEAADLTGAWTHDADGEEVGDAGTQAERAVARNDYEGQSASSSAAASSAAEQAAAPQPLKPTKRVRWLDQHEADAERATKERVRRQDQHETEGQKASSSAAASSAPEQAAVMQPPKPKKRKVKRKKQTGRGARKRMDKHKLTEDG